MDAFLVFAYKIYFRYLPSYVYTDVLNWYFAEACENIWLKQSIMDNTALSFCTAIVVFIDKFIDSAFSQGKKLMFHLKNVTSKASILSLSGVWVALSKLKSKLSISCHLKWFRVTRYMGIATYGSARSLYSMRNSTTSVNWKFKSKLNSLSVVLWNMFSINQRRSQTKKYSTKVLEVAEAR